MTAPADLPYVWLIALALVVLAVIVALCLQDNVKTGLKVWSVSFFLEAHKNKDPKRQLKS
jgi:hypothetical protein